MTLRPLGPRVTLTARASLATPLRSTSRASCSKAICLAAMGSPIESGSCVFHSSRGPRGPWVNRGSDLFLLANHIIRVARIESALDAVHHKIEVLQHDCTNQSRVTFRLDRGFKDAVAAHQL